MSSFEPHRSRRPVDGADEVRTTFCRICIAACGLEVTVAGDTVLQVRGDDEHPLTKGYTCAKGRAVGLAHHAPSRLNGAFLGRGRDRRPASIGDAHAHLADALGAVVARHGLGAVGVFHGTGAFQDGLGSWTARRLKKALGSHQLYSTATVDAVARTYVAEQMAGTPLLTPNVDEEEGRLLIFVGINPVVSHGHATMFSNPVERIRAARGRGLVVTLDPRLTETARLSDLHLAVRPGSDYTVMAHLVREVLRRGVDAVSLERRARGLDALRESVERFDRATTVAHSGVSDSELASLVDAVLGAGRIAVLSGTGSTMAPSANVTEWLSWALMVLTDSFDQPGGMWFNPGAFARLQRFEQLPAAAPSRPSPPSRPDVARCNGEWPAALIPDEIESGRLRALIVLGSNLVTALPDPARVERALGDVEVLVTLDVVHNQTTDLATHAFACAGQLERADVLPLELNANAVYQHVTEPVVSPRDDRPPMWQTLARLGAGIGLDVLGGGADPVTTTTDQLLARMAGPGALDELRAAGGLRVYSGPVYGWVQDRLPFGGWDLAPSPLVAQLAELGESRPGDAGSASAVLVPRRAMRQMNWQRFRGAEPHEALMHPETAAAGGLVDGEHADVSTAQGVVRLRVRVSPDIVPGAVSILHGYPDANVNVLLDRHDLDPHTGMARLASVPVQLAPVSVGFTPERNSDHA